MKEIATLNEQLLRAIGFGVALFHADSGARIFANEAFEQWFAADGEGSGLAQILQTADISAVTQAIAAEGSFKSEISFRVKRRMTVLAIEISESAVGDTRVLILQAQNITRIRELETMIESYSAMVERNAKVIEREKAQVEKLLLNILPKGAYEEYKAVGVVTPSRYEAVGVLVLDFVEFHEALETMAPASFIAELNELHAAFDRIAEQFGCERIKTTGDTYVVVSGLQDLSANHGEAIFEAARRFVRFLRRRSTVGGQAWSCRIGLGVGPVLGSVIGAQRYVYDVFGPAVARAAKAKDQAQALEIWGDENVVAAVPNAELRQQKDGFAHLVPDETD